MELTLEGRQHKILRVAGGSVRIEKKTILFGSKREKVLPIRNISSVEVKKPGALTAGFIQFSIAGGVARNSSYTFTGGAYSAAQDENSVLFVGDDNYQKALEIQSYVENFLNGAAS